MAASIPKRKNRTPFIGKRVLDGRTSDFDWEGNVPPKDLPRSINPKRGYIVTANNRQAPDHASHDYGASPPSTGRAQRIDEIIQQKIKGGEKLSAADVQAIQQDPIDVQARDVTPSLLNVVKRILPELSADEKHSI